MGSHFRFIHCADLHLGSRFRGVSEEDPRRARELTGSIPQSFSRIVDLVASEHADAMVIAGDAFDETTITPRTRMELVDGLSRAGVPVFMVRGNHDPVTSYEDSIPLPPNVHMFGPEPENVPVPGHDGIEVAGVSFADWHEERNLPSMLHGTPGRFTIGLVHCDVDSAGGEYDYSPCRLSDLSGRGVDYWALGHIHKRAVLSTDPWAVYPGNIQGRSMKETGEKGAYVVDVEDGRVSDVRFVPTQGIIWFDEEVDITGMRTRDDLVSALRGRVPPGSILRTTMVGRGPLDAMLRRDPGDVEAMIGSSLGCRTAGMEVRTGPDIDIEARRGTGDMVGMVASAGDRLKQGGRDAVLGVIASNPVAKSRMDDFEAMSDEELEGAVDSAVMTLAGIMEAGR